MLLQIDVYMRVRVGTLKSDRYVVWKAVGCFFFCVTSRLYW